MPAISIIMSAYNTDAYIRKAIQSVLDQTFADFEFLIVDNGSTDNTGKIIDEYAANDTRIHAFHNEKNEKLSEAWSMLLNLSKGQYLCLFDSDDWIAPDMLECMYNRAKKHDAQYVYCGFYMDYRIGDCEYSYSVCPVDADYNQLEFRKVAVDDLVRSILTVPWNKLYSLKYIKDHNIQFRITNMLDHHFNMDMIMDIDRVSSISKPFYHYNRIRIGSHMALAGNSYLNQKKRDHIAHTMAVFEHWGINDSETMGKLADYHLGRLVQCISETMGSKNYDKSSKTNEIKIILSDKWTEFALKNWSRSSLKLRLITIPIRMRSIFLCKLFGAVISKFQNDFPALFYKLRNSVAQKGVKNN